MNDPNLDAYGGLAVARDGPVARILLPRHGGGTDGLSDLHWELHRLLSALREDNDIRVIVLTGADDGEFKTPGEARFDEGPGRAVVTDPGRAWKNFMGTLRVHQLMAEIEKPIVCRLNGPAIGWGAGVVFGSDIIVARDDAVVGDMHMSDEGDWNGLPSVVPGAIAAQVPLFLSPVMAKEFLLLNRQFSARDLAQWGVINYAVPAAELDSVVDDIVQRLLQRSAFALAWTKRVASRRVVDHLNLTLDASVAYEMVNWLQEDRTGYGGFASLG